MQVFDREEDESNVLIIDDESSGWEQEIPVSVDEVSKETAGKGYREMAFKSGKQSNTVPSFPENTSVFFLLDCSLFLFDFLQLKQSNNSYAFAFCNHVIVVCA